MSQPARKNLRESRRRHRIRYQDALTVHGLTKILEGTIVEKLIWIAFVAASIAGAFILTQAIWKHYLERKVNAEIEIVEQEELTYPAITICNDLMSRNKYSTEVKSHEDVPLLLKNSVRCGGNNDKCFRGTSYGVKVRLIAADYASTEDALNLVSFHSETGNACFTVKGQKQKVPGNILSIKVYRNRSSISNPWSSVHINSKDEPFFEANPTVYYVTEKDYYFILSRKVLKRLPAPYRSNCKDNSEPNRKFNSAYSVTKCRKQCMLEECIKNCNTVPGMYKQYFPTSTNIGAAQTDTCLEDVLKNTSMQVTCHKNCRTQPCDEELHEATVVHTSSTEERNELQMGFTFPSLSETRITEQAA